MNDKTDLRAACDVAAREWILSRNGGNDSAHCRCSDCERIWAIQKEAQQIDTKELSRVIERHIAPLLKSVRVAAIEECAKRLEEYIVDGRSEAEKLLQTAANDIRALKEQP